MADIGEIRRVAGDLSTAFKGNSESFPCLLLRFKDIVFILRRKSEPIFFEEDVPKGTIFAVVS